MEIGETLYVTDRAQWRRWLEQNYQDKKDIWLVYYRKESGKPRIPYKEAVYEALCFGWIDSQVGNLDDERFAQRFTPRKPGSPYSQTNKERLKRLVDDGQVMPDVLETIGEYDPETYSFPDDIIIALRENEAAWENFQGYPPPYQRIRVAFVDAARSRPEEFSKRLDNLISKTAAGKQFGYGIEEFY